MAPEIHVVSAERIAQELKRMLVDPHRRRAMELARDTQLLLEILPELRPILDDTSHLAGEGGAKSLWEISLRRLRLLEEPRFELAAAALLASVPEIGASPSAGRQEPRVARGVCKRLRLSNQETDSIEWLLTHLSDVFASSTKSLAQLKRMLAHPDARDLLALARADRLAAESDLSGVMHCEELLQRTPPEKLDPPPFVTGDDLIARGLPPGKRIREILDTIREAQLNEEITTKEEAFRLLDRLLNNPPERGT
jgi:poly(A) polymerase